MAFFHCLNNISLDRPTTWINRNRYDYDPRPLLKDGDTVTINYLLDLMITRSDNSAANCLIDVATRDSINKTMHENGWMGSRCYAKIPAKEI